MHPALGHASPSQRMARSAGGSDQQAGSGHLDVERSLVPRPRIHFKLQERVVPRHVVIEHDVPECFGGCGK
jgi:hypothetical protein